MEPYNAGALAQLVPYGDDRRRPLPGYSRRPRQSKLRKRARALRAQRRRR